jgi:spermidine/putrescine transport system substrate-binding protein
MEGDPRRGSRQRRAVGRRQFLRSSAATAFALSSASTLLSACGAGRNSSAAFALEVASPDNPVALNLFDDNPPIESNLEPEAGPLKIFNWSEYIFMRVVKDFEKEFGVDVEITTFYNMEEAIKKLRAGGVSFDLFFPTIYYLSRLVAAKMLQPLNHSYLPNLEANVWPELVDPFYDRQSRYTVPYTLYTTGIGYRTDMVDEDIGERDNPYDALWDPKYSGKVGIYDDYREAMSMVMLRNGHTDINTDDPRILEQTKNDLIAMTEDVRVRTSIDGGYSGIPEGRYALHQAWAGDIVAAPYYFPEGGDPDVLRYWFPPDGRGAVGNDTIAVPVNAEHPVLAHTFLNYLLDNEVAAKNFSWVGYQPPLNSMDPATLIDGGYVLPTLESAVIKREHFRNGYPLLALAPETEAQWQYAWAEFKAGA